MAKTTPRNGHIILPVNTDLFEGVEENAKEHGVNTDLFESVEENAKEHGVTIGQYLDMLLQRHITPKCCFT